MNNVFAVEVRETMRLLLVIGLVLALPAFAFAQEASGGDDVRSADEIPEDMPDPPEDAPPAEAPPVDGTDERPPHPETPEDLEELQPTAETLAKTSYHWLPGHWMWTGEQFERRVGLQGQGHDPRSAALGVGRQAVGIPRRRLGEAGDQQSRLSSHGRAGRTGYRCKR
jgi:hypothetical protein